MPTLPNLSKVATSKRRGSCLWKRRRTIKLIVLAGVAVASMICDSDKFGKIVDLVIAILGW